MKNIPFRPRAVIFDMDGVIADSMPYHFMAWYEALRPWGVRVNCFDVYEREGEKWDRTLKAFLRRDGVRPTPVLMKKIFAERQRIFKEKFRRYIFDDAAGFVACLKDRAYPLGLVTGTPSDEMERILPAGIKRRLDVIITGDRIKRGKPYPDPYVRAAKLLTVPPSRCLVIENAPFGIESAKRAGMFCVALTTSLPADYLRRADIVVRSLAEVIPLIDKTCAVK